MSWRIAYWRGSTRVRMTTVEDISQDEVAARLRNLAFKHFDLEYLRASEADAPETLIAPARCSGYGQRLSLHSRLDLRGRQ